MEETETVKKQSLPFGSEQSVMKLKTYYSIKVERTCTVVQREAAQCRYLLPGCLGSLASSPTNYPVILIKSLDPPVPSSAYLKDVLKHLKGLFGKK